MNSWKEYPYTSFEARMAFNTIHGIIRTQIEYYEEALKDPNKTDEDEILNQMIYDRLMIAEDIITDASKLLLDELYSKEGE